MAKMPITVLGIDLGKNSCSVAGLDMNGAVVLRRRMTRESLVTFASKLPACDERIRAYDDELAAMTRENQQARQLATIPGIGVIIIGKHEGAHW